MKRILVFSISLISCISAFGQVSASDLLGQWRNGDATAVIEFSEKEKEFQGKIVWLKEPVDSATGKPKTDRKNPDENARSKAVLGLVIAWGFRFDANEEAWEKGRIYDPKKGKTYDCEITMKSSKQLRVRGYVLGMPFLGRTELWVRQ